MPDCPECGSTNTVPVWEDPHLHRVEPPDHVGCLDCNTMTTLNERREP